MTETFVGTQVRLVLEQQGAAVFQQLYVGPLRSFGFSIIVFDFVSPGGAGNVAFKTSLSLPTLVETAEALVASFSGGPRRYAPRGLPAEVLPTLGAAAQRLLPAGVGYAIIVGDARASAYVSNADRADVAELFRNDLLPEWRLDCAARG
jgi:hypothetical protein